MQQFTQFVCLFLPSIIFLSTLLSRPHEQMTAGHLRFGWPEVALQGRYTWEDEVLGVVGMGTHHSLVSSTNTYQQQVFWRFVNRIHSESQRGEFYRVVSWFLAYGLEVFPPAVRGEFLQRQLFGWWCSHLPLSACDTLSSSW